MIALLVAGAVALVVSALGTKLLIELLGVRRLGQPIMPEEAGGPKGHARKSGTPTMGGIAIVVAAFIGYSAAHFRRGLVFTRSGLLVLGLIVGAGVVGLLDDWIKVRNARNLGLKKRAKVLGLLTVGIAFAVLTVFHTTVSTTLSFTR